MADKMFENAWPIVKKISELHLWSLSETNYRK